MKKLSVLLCLLGLSGTGWAESLIIIGITNDGVLYGDLSSRTPNRAWFVYNYTKPQKLPFNPRKFNTHNCLMLPQAHGAKICINLSAILTHNNYAKNRFILWLACLLGLAHLGRVYLFFALCWRKNYLCLPTCWRDWHSNLVDIIA